MALPSVPPGISPIRVALELAITIYFWVFIGAIIATGAPYPPTVPSLYAPALTSLLAGLSAYAAARRIALPMTPVNP